MGTFQRDGLSLDMVGKGYAPTAQITNCADWKQLSPCLERVSRSQDPQQVALVLPVFLCHFAGFKLWKQNHISNRGAVSQ